MFIPIHVMYINTPTAKRLLIHTSSGFTNYTVKSLRLTDINPVSFN